MHYCIYLCYNFHLENTLHWIYLQNLESMAFILISRVMQMTMSYLKCDMRITRESDRTYILGPC